MTVGTGVTLAWLLRAGLVTSQEQNLHTLSDQHAVAVAQVLLTRLQTLSDQVEDDAVLFASDPSDKMLRDLSLARGGRQHRHCPAGSPFFQRAISDPDLPDPRSLEAPRIVIIEADDAGLVLMLIAPVPALVGRQNGVFVAHFELKDVFELANWAAPGFHSAVVERDGTTLAAMGSRESQLSWTSSYDFEVAGIRLRALAHPTDETRDRVRTWLPELVLCAIVVASLLLAVAILIAGALAAKAQSERAAQIEVRKETLLRSAVFDQAAEGMCVFERHESGGFRLVAYNDPVKELLVASAELGGTRSPADMFEADFADQLVSLMADEFTGVEMRLLDCHDEPRALLVSGSHIDAGERNLVLVLLNDFTDRRKLQFELAQIAAREQQRIGQDLHDVIGQQLAAIKVIGRTIEIGLKRENSQQREPVSMLLAHVGEAIDQVRAVSAMLVPISRRAGFIQSLEILAQRVRTAFGVEINLTISLDLVMGLSTDASTNLYRIIQESINNAITHGKSSIIDVRLHFDGAVPVLVIRDNGTGIGEQVVPGVGLRTLEFRAEQIGWEVEVESSATGGTVVQCRRSSLQTVNSK